MLNFSYRGFSCSLYIMDTLKNINSCKHINGKLVMQVMLSYAYEQVLHAVRIMQESRT